MNRSAVVALACSAAVVGGTSASFAATHDPHGSQKAHRNDRAGIVCSDGNDSVRRLDLTVDGAKAWGFYAVPRGKARGIVVFDHGYGHTAFSWVEHLRQVAKRDGVIAVAMDYHGQHDTAATKPGGLPSSRGWRVQEGADDSLAAAKLFDRVCAPTGINSIYGVSMGGNTSGLVVAANAKRANGKPLFDYWYAIEPAANVTETWTEASALSPSGNAFAQQAVADIEDEMGGTPLTAPEAYADHSVVARIADVATAGLKGVAVVQGVDDGLVPYNQSRELVTELRAAGIPTYDVTAGSRGDAETGTTASGYALGPLGQESPLAGHGSEVSNTQLVIKTGFQLLDKLYLKQAPPSCGAAFVDGAAGEWTASTATC